MAGSLIYITQMFYNANNLSGRCTFSQFFQSVNIGKNSDVTMHGHHYYYALNGRCGLEKVHTMIFIIQTQCYCAIGMMPYESNV